MLRRGQPVLQSSIRHDVFTPSAGRLLRFGSVAPTIPGYPQADLQLILNSMDHCRYRKPLEKMLQDQSPFRLSMQNGQITVHGYDYHAPDENKQEIDGVCHELSYYLMRRLEKALGKRYEFAMIDGQCEQYFSIEGANHVYIIGRQKNRNPFRRTLAEIVQAACKAGDKKLPADCLLIDPSFKILNDTNGDTGYAMKSLVTGSASKCKFQAATDEDTLVFDEDSLTPSWPLGYWGELLDLSRFQNNPSLPPDRTLVYWSLEKPGQATPDLVLFVQPESDQRLSRLTDAHWVLQTQTPDNPLRRFVNKVRRELGHPDAI